MLSIPAAVSWEEAVQQVDSAPGHTRIPVFGKNRDDIVGILYIKDLLPELAKPPQDRVQPWTKLLRQPVFVPETKPVDALLQDFQREAAPHGRRAGRIRRRLRRGDHGGRAGGDRRRDRRRIRQRRGRADPPAGRRACAKRWAASTSTTLNEQLGLELPEDADFDTIGGFVFSELGHIPWSARSWSGTTSASRCWRPLAAASSGCGSSRWKPRRGAKLPKGSRPSRSRFRRFARRAAARPACDREIPTTAAPSADAANCEPPWSRSDGRARG